MVIPLDSVSLRPVPNFKGGRFEELPRNSNLVLRKSK